MLTLAPAVGRPPELDEADTRRLWYAWQERLTVEDKNGLAATDYLELQRQTGIGLRSLWALVQRWETYGESIGRAPAERVAENGP